MNRTPIGIVVLVSALVIISCATSMTPSQFLGEFPKITKSKFYDRQGADEAIANGKCKMLVGGRKYTSPIGLTVYGDLQTLSLLLFAALFCNIVPLHHITFQISETVV